MALTLRWFKKKNNKTLPLKYQAEYYNSVHEMLSFSPLDLNIEAELTDILCNIKTHISYVQSGNKIIHVAHARYISTLNETAYVLCLDAYNTFTFCSEPEIQTGKYKPVCFELYEPSVENETLLVFDKPVTGNAVADIFKHIIIYGITGTQVHKTFMDRIVLPIIKNTNKSMDLVSDYKIKFNWFNATKSVQIDKTINYVDTLNALNISAEIFLKTMLNAQSIAPDQFQNCKSVILNINSAMNALNSFELTWNDKINSTINRSEKILNSLASILILRRWAKNNTSYVQTIMVDFLNEDFYKRCQEVSKKLFKDLKINADKKTTLAEKLIPRKSNAVNADLGVLNSKEASDLLDEIINELKEP